MPDYRLSKPALKDLEKIRIYLTQRESVRTADYVESELFAAFDEIASLPAIGHSRYDIRQPALLVHTVFRYLVVFRRLPAVEVMRVIHGSRDVEKIF